MAAKILVTGLANTGKTSLLKSLKDVFIIAHDGKKYPFPQPHINVDTFVSTAELLSLINTKISIYQDKFKALPATLAIDSVSKIFESIASKCAQRYKGFDVWKNVNEEIYQLTDYIESVLISNGINVVIVSHATWDVDTASYNLVGQGSFAKRGGFLAEVDESIFIEIKSGKRIVHHKTIKFPCRTLLAELPDSEPVEEFDLQLYVSKLTDSSDTVADFLL